MKTYSLVQPIFKNSTKLQDIRDEENRVIGKIGRYYKNKIQYLLDLILSIQTLNIKVYDQSSNLIVNATQKVKLFGDDWEISHKGERYYLKNITKVKTNPRFEFVYNETKYMVFKDFADKYIKLKNIETNLIVAEYKFITLKPPRKILVKNFNEEINDYLLMGVFTLLSYNN